MPQPNSDGIAPARSSIAESSRPTSAQRAEHTRAFHGSARLGVIIEPFAKLVSRTGTGARSTTTTSQPSLRR